MIANTIPPILAVVGPAVKSRFRFPGRSHLALGYEQVRKRLAGIKRASPEFKTREESMTTRLEIVLAFFSARPFSALTL